VISWEGGEEKKGRREKKKKRPEMNFRWATAQVRIATTTVKKLWSSE
jgi:hypothetical protein